MIRLRSLRSDEQGTAVIETAIALPVLVLFIWGIFQVGIAGQAIAGMQAGLGEGARMATICQSPTAAGACAVPTDAAIKARINAKVFGTGVGTFADPTVTTPDPADCTNCRDLSVTFTMPLSFLFFNGPDINLTRSKRVYLAT
jgi:Flp pilus assembly protein TadG